MTGTRLFRIGGLLVFVGAVAFVLHVVLRSVLTAGVDPAVSAQAGLWVPVNALGALGAALVLLGLPAVYARMARQGGLPGLVGFTLIEVSWMFFGLFLSLYGALVLPWLADQAPRLVAASAPTPLGFVVAFALGLLAWLLGAVLLAVPFVRGPSRVRWVGYVLPASALWVLVGSFVVAPGGPASNLAVNLLSNLGPVLLLIGLGYLGFRAWAERPGQARRAGCRWLTAGPCVAGAPLLRNTEAKVGFLRARLAPYSLRNPALRSFDRSRQHAVGLRPPSSGGLLLHRYAYKPWYRGRRLSG